MNNDLFLYFVYKKYVFCKYYGLFTEIDVPFAEY